MNGNRLSRTQNSLINLLTGTAGSVLVTVLKFVTRTVFIATLGREYLGINGLFADIMSMLSLTDLGLGLAMNFKLYKPLAERDEHRVRLLMKLYRDAYRIVGLAIGVLGLCMIPFLPLLISDIDSLYPLGVNPVLIFVIYLMQSVSSYLFWASCSAVVRADQRSYLLNIAGYVITLATNVVQILILIFWRDFIAYTVTVIVFNLIQNGVNAAIAKRLYPYAFEKTKERLDRREIRDIFKDLGALFIYQANGVAVRATGNIVLSAFIGLGIVGLYSNYMMFYTAVNTILMQVYNAIKASAGNLFAVSDEDKKYRFFRTMNFATIMLYGTACVGVAVVADEAISCWLGADFVIAQPFALLLGVEILFAGLKANLGQIRNVSGLFRQMWYRPLLGIMINLAVSIVTVQFLGINGVLLGVIMSAVCANFLIDPGVIYKHAFGSCRPVREYYLSNFGYMLVLVLTGLADSWICRNVFVGHGWFSLIFHVIVCGLSVPGALMLVYGRSPECRHIMATAKSLLRRGGRKRKGSVRHG